MATASARGRSLYTYLMYPYIAKHMDETKCPGCPVCGHPTDEHDVDGSQMTCLICGDGYRCMSNIGASRY